MRKGKVVLIPFPFTGLSGSKVRPAVMLAGRQNDIVVAFITTQLSFQEDYDLLLTPDSRNGLKKPSVLKLTKLATLERRLVLGEIGELSAEDLRTIDQRLLLIFEISI